MLSLGAYTQPQLEMDHETLSYPLHEIHQSIFDNIDPVEGTNHQIIRFNRQNKQCFTFGEKGNNKQTN